MTLPQRTEGRLNLDFQGASIWRGFFESLKYAEISLKNIEFKNQFLGPEPSIFCHFFTRISKTMIFEFLVEF